MGGVHDSEAFLGTTMNDTNPIPAKNRDPLEADSSARGVTAAIDAVQRKAHIKIPPIESVEQLLRAVYAGTFKRKALTKKELSAMCGARALGLQESDDILNQTVADRTLKRTLQLTLLGIGIDPSPVTDQIGKFVHEVLRRHPAFTEESLAEVEGPAIEALASRDYGELSWPDSGKLIAKERGQCRENAVKCLLLWFRMMREVPVERVHHYLAESLWESAVGRVNTDAGRLRVLMSTRDPAAAQIATGILRRQALEQSERADAAQIRESRATKRVEELEEALAKIQAKLATSQAEVDTFRKELERERKEHADNRAHFQDDYENLRGGVIGRLTTELSLLDEGLRALLREPPKVHVMVDHAERVIDGLKSERERLRGDRGHS